MKKIFVLFIALIVVALGYAQKSNCTDSQQKQNTEQLNIQLSSKNLKKRIDDINNLIIELKDDINTKYQKYSNQKKISDEETRNKEFNSLKAEMNSLRNQTTQLNHDIESLKDEYRLVDRIRAYYENSNIDSLFVHADLMSLQIHKDIFGGNYPKVMDNLQILLECAELLTKGYNENQNRAYVNRLKGVRQCDTKDLLEGFLLVQKDVTNEVNKWIKDEEHTLYSLVMFRRYLYNNYGIMLDAVFPDLSAKVIEMVKLPLPIK